MISALQIRPDTVDSPALPTAALHFAVTEHGVVDWPISTGRDVRLAAPHDRFFDDRPSIDDHFRGWCEISGNVLHTRRDVLAADGKVGRVHDDNTRRPVDLHEADRDMSVAASSGHVDVEEDCFAFGAVDEEVTNCPELASAHRSHLPSTNIWFPLRDAPILEAREPVETVAFTWVRPDAGGVAAMTIVGHDSYSVLRQPNHGSKIWSGLPKGMARQRFIKKK
jgi:hypothetical protein